MQAPDFWRPFGRAEPVPFTRDVIGKGSVVFSTSIDSKPAAAVYDPQADRWHLYRLPDAHGIAVDHPHVWLVEKNGDCVYYNTATGLRRGLKSVLSPSLLKPRMKLPDLRVWPKVVAADGKWWRGALKAYDPAKGKWESRDTAGLPEKPLSVLDAIETDAFLWVVFAVHDHYCGDSPCRLYVLDKTTRSWSLITKDVGQIHRANAGVWVQGTRTRLWDATRRAFTRELPKARAICPAGDRVWAIRQPSRLVTDGRKGQWTTVREKGMSNCGARAEALCHDGRYVWAWEHKRRPFGLVTRYDPKTKNSISYPVVDGLTGPVSDITFGKHAIWFRGRDLVRYDRAKDSWRTFTTRDGLPRNRGFYAAVGDETTFIFVDRLSILTDPKQLSGIAHYDPATEKLTYYPSGECTRPAWVGARVPREMAELWPSPDARSVWTMLMASHRLRPSFQRPICFDGDKVWLCHRRRLYRWDAKNGKLSIRDAFDHVAWVVADRNAVWLVRYCGALAVRLDKGSGEAEEFGPVMPKNVFAIGFIKYADEIWFSQRPPSGRGGGRLVHVNLSNKKWKVFTGRHWTAIGHGVIPVDCDDDYLWCRGSGLAGGRVAIYLKKKRRWKALSYLAGGNDGPWGSGGIWFDGDWAYCNINRALHRARKIDLVKSVQ